MRVAPDAFECSAEELRAALPQLWQRAWRTERLVVTIQANSGIDVPAGAAVSVVSLDTGIGAGVAVSGQLVFGVTRLAVSTVSGWALSVGPFQVFLLRHTQRPGALAALLA